jgi:hypothetical protein
MLASLEPTPLYGPACAILIALSKKELLKNFGPLCQTIGSMNHLHLVKKYPKQNYLSTEKL